MFDTVLAFQLELSQLANQVSQLNVTLGETFIDKQNATVQLSLRQYYEGPFNNLSRYSETAQLTLEGGNWKMVSGNSKNGSLEQVINYENHS